MANPGYGKRDAPDQRPRTNHDFAHLPPREAAVAAYIDRLPGGADISVKTLAKHVRTASALSVRPSTTFAKRAICAGAANT